MQRFFVNYQKENDILIEKKYIYFNTKNLKYKKKKIEN